MAVVPTPHPSPRTYIWYVGEYLRQLKNRVRELANAIDDIFIIGDHLAAPFYDWAWYIGVASDFLFQADDFIRSLKGWLDGLYDGWNFVNLINWASWHFNEIRTNAVNWVKYRLGEANYWLNWLVWNPQAFLDFYIKRISYWVTRIIENPQAAINDIFRGFKWWIGYFLDNPRDWIVSQLQGIMPTLLNFLYQPINYILDILRQRIIDFDLLLSSPQNWVIRQLIKQVPELISFWSNPIEYLKTRIAQWFGLPPNFWYNPQLYLINHLFDSLEIYLLPLINRIARIAIEVILRFI
jgi:hypothetical protein